MANNMSSRSLDDLKPEIQYQAREVIDRCRDRGVDLLIYCTYRSPEEQARLFRRSRRLKEIETKAELFRIRGYDFLADTLMGMGPQYGKLGVHVTHAGPGESFHQYGRAFDAVPMRDGKCLWDIDWPEWNIYGEAVKVVGLHWAGTWHRHSEYPHTQDLATSNPLRVLAVNEVVDQLMRLKK